MSQTASPERVVSGNYELTTGRVTQPMKAEEWSTTVVLGPLEDPGTPEDHVLSYMIGKDRAGGAPVNVQVVLMEGDEELASFDHPDVQVGIKPVRQPIPPAIAARIKDYTNLRVKMNFKRGY